MVKHYPLSLTPVYKEMLWGGDRLKTMYRRKLPSNKTGESWDISCRPGEMGIIKYGIGTGTSLEDYINQDRVGVLGSRLAGTTRFPLLVKLIDANDALSVQVHPGDSYASATNGQDTGKTEMWYILTPPKDGKLIMGLKPGITPEILRRAYEDGTVEDCLNHLPVAAGDIVNIPAGLIHALTPGVMVAEVQQNSDITYRLYDYNRVGPDGKPRELHVDDAIAVTDFEGKIPVATVPGLTIKKRKCTRVYAIANPHFAVIKYVLAGKVREASNPEAFAVFTCVDGSAAIRSETMLVVMKAGDSVFVPAGVGKYELRGQCTLLKSFVPDVQADFVAPLRAAGYSLAEIEANTAVAQS